MKFYINGIIGYQATLDGLSKNWNDKITDVYINSLGGDVWEGLAIYNFLKEKQINTHTNGVVASIASIIFLAGKKRTANQYDDFLIHLPYSFAEGTSDELKKYADDLKKIENKLAKIYELETNLSFDDAIQQMNKDEMVSPEWLKENGFIHEIKELKAVAILNDKKMELTTKDKTWLENQLKAIKNLFNPVALKLQDANGIEIDFYELETDATPEIGDKAKIDGKDANGEITMPTGEVYVFEKGTLKEILEPTDEEVETLKKENETLKAEIEALKDAAIKAENKIKEIQSKFETFQNSLKTKFDWDGKKTEKEIDKTRKLFNKKI